MMPSLDEILRLDLEGLLQRPAGPAFGLPANRCHVHKAKAALKAQRRGIRALIKPENALPIIGLLPECPDDRTHVVLRGDFVLCDLIPAIIDARGRCPHLHVATLGLSSANADQIVRLIGMGKLGAASLVVSHYFAKVDKLTTFRDVAARLEGIATLRVTRNHCKVICLPTESGDSFVIEGSANLRSSDNIEQIVITNDPETLAFHVSWMQELPAV
jgi:hypothetical protein